MFSGGKADMFSGGKADLFSGGEHTCLVVEKQTCLVVEKQTCLVVEKQTCLTVESRHACVMSKDKDGVRFVTKKILSFSVSISLTHLQEHMLIYYMHKHTCTMHGCTTTVV